MRGNIYIITSPLLAGIKIGKTKNDRGQLRSRYITSLGTEMEIVEFMPTEDMDSAEKIIFELLRKHKINGELFRREKLKRCVRICKTVTSGLRYGPFTELTVGQLKDVEIWKGQRILRESRTNEIFNYYNDYFEKTGRLPAIFALTACLLDNTLYLIDGQHRLSAVRKVCEKYTGLRNTKIPFYVHEVKNEQEIRDEFIAFNKLQPIEDWEEDLSENTVETYELVRKCVEKLSTLFPSVIVTGASSKRLLRHKIYSEEIINFVMSNGIADEFKTPEALQEHLLAFNTWLMSMPMGEFPIRRKNENIGRYYNLCLGARCMFPLIKTTFDYYYKKFKN